MIPEFVPTETIYHVAAAADWHRAQERGVYTGGTACRADGFIHFSTVEQVPGTLARFFAGRDDLLLLYADVLALGPDLRWEKAADGATFPHFYGVMAPSQLTELGPIVVDPSGTGRLPPGFGGNDGSGSAA